MTPTAAQKATEQRSFNFLFPYGARTLVTTGQAARAFGRGEHFVRALVDEGKLETHKDSALGERLSNRITSRSVLLHLARTADYDPAQITDSLIDVIDTLSDQAALTKIIAAATRRRTQL